jgi:hypothetical protein
MFFLSLFTSITVSLPVAVSAGLPLPIKQRNFTGNGERILRGKATAPGNGSLALLKPD